MGSVIGADSRLGACPPILDGTCAGELGLDCWRVMEDGGLTGVGESNATYQPVAKGDDWVSFLDRFFLGWQRNGGGRHGRSS